MGEKSKPFIFVSQLDCEIPDTEYRVYFLLILGKYIPQVSTVPSWHPLPSHAIKFPLQTLSLIVDDTNLMRDVEKYKLMYRELPVCS